MQNPKYELTWNVIVNIVKAVQIRAKEQLHGGILALHYTKEEEKQVCFSDVFLFLNKNILLQGNATNNVSQQTPDLTPSPERNQTISRSK
jgi:hypothetical protein